MVFYHIYITEKQFEIREFSLSLIIEMQRFYIVPKVILIYLFFPFSLQLHLR
jgi:hypothetical protein